VAAMFSCTFVVPHHNVLLYDISLREFLVIAYRYIKKDLFHS
jgi:hypothetical protein